MTVQAAPALPASLSNPQQVAIVRSLEPVLQVYAIEHYLALERQGIRLQFNSGRRSPAAQASLFEAAQNDPDSLPAARPGLSLHEYGLAYDGEPSPKTDATWAIYGAEAERLGLVWGGSWSGRKDPPHVQFPGKGDLLRQLGKGGLLLALTLAVVKLARSG